MSGKSSQHTWPAWAKALGLFYFLLANSCSATKTTERPITWEDLQSVNSQWEYRRDIRQKYGSVILPEKNYSPKFYSPSLKLLVQRGDRLLLPCVVQDLGEDHIIWRHGANIIAGSNIPTFFDEEGRIRLYENFTLEITKVTEKDEGEYECLLASPSSTSSSSAMKLTHTVTVQDPPTIAVLPAKGSVVVIEGETVQIGCIPQGNPKPRIVWSKKDGAIPEHHHKLFNESVITMNRVSRKHTGLYVCSADNGVGLPAIGAVYVRVLHSPEVEVPKRRVHGGIRHRATLTCIVYADPTADVQWYVGQRPVAIGDRIRKETRDKIHSLTIYSIRESDFGTYVCTANNTYGHDLRHIEFSGVPNPPIVKRWETIQWPPAEILTNEIKVRESKAEQDNLQVNGSVQSEQPYNNEIPLPSPTSPAKPEVQVQLLWAVECYSPLIDYRLAFRPAPTQAVTAANEANSPIWTELTIPADPSSTFLHTKSFVLRGLELDRIYESAIKARNRYGWSPISSLFYFSTFPNTSSSGTLNLTELMKGEGTEAVLRSQYAHHLFGKGFKNDTEPYSSASSSHQFNLIHYAIAAALYILVMVDVKLW